MIELDDDSSSDMNRQNNDDAEMIKVLDESMSHGISQDDEDAKWH